VSAPAQTKNTLEVILTRLHEPHELSAYEAVDRLVHAGEAVGMDTDTILRMLDQGMPFQKLLELIVSKSLLITSIAPLESKRKPEPVQPAQPEKTLRQMIVA